VKRLAVFGVLMMLFGCRHVRVPRIGEPAPVNDDDAREAAWQETLTKYSDRAQIYDGLDTRLFCAGTWQSPFFADARVTRLAEFQRVPPDTIPGLIEAERARLANATEVFLAFHVNEPKHDDFDRYNSIWKITLIACGKVYPSTSVSRVGRASLNLRAIYSYVDTFWVAYRVRFPMPEGCNDEKILVQIASTLGHAGLEFPFR
jgi:hypothetical protein